MWSPIKIEIRNLFSHRDSTYVFRNGVCTVIFGHNETDRAMENNGSGKSTLFEGIGIALTGDDLRNLGKDAFINYESETCEVDLELENKFLNSTLRIYRKFIRGKTTLLTLWENGEINKKVVSTNEANKRIFELLGITKEDLLRYFIIDQDSKFSFFTANDLDKKEIMNRITSADMINPAIEELVKRNKEYKALLDGVNLETDKLIAKVDLIDEQKAELELEDTTAEDIKELETDKKTKQESMRLRMEENGRLDEDVKSKQKDFETKKVSIEEKTKLKKESSDKVKELSDTVKIIRTLKNELEEIITCPHCKKDFILNSEYQLTIPEAKELLALTEKLKLAIEADFLAITKKEKAIQERQETADDITEEIRVIQRKNKRNTEEIDYEAKEVYKIQQKINALKASKKDNKALKLLNEKLSEINAELKLKSKEAAGYSDELEMISFWQYNMGKSGFLTYLANKSIKIIEGMTNSFLKKFGVDTSVLINGFKILKDGSVREKIDVFVQNDGITPQVFKGKSGGERGRVQVAGILGIQHLINLSTNGLGLNLLLLDEVFPGVDSMGQENIIKILEKMGITILMITQTVSEGFNNENALYVKKVDGNSYYTELPKLLV